MERPSVADNSGPVFLIAGWLHLIRAQLQIIRVCSLFDCRPKMPSIAGLPSSDCRSLHLLKEQFIDAIKLQANDFNDKKITLYYFFIERMVSNNRKIGFKSI